VSRAKIGSSILLWLLVAACAWPAFVAANGIISYFNGEGSVLDLWTQEPKRKLVDEFINGYKASAIIAALIGFIAVVDYQLLSRSRLTGFIAGILLPIACIAIAFIYYSEPGYMLPAMALMGFLLWIVYKFVDIGFRLRRVG